MPVALDPPPDVVSGLRERIARLEDGAKLPTVRELMREFGVGQAVVGRAVQTLVDDGLVRAEVGRGTFVTKSGSPAEKSVIILNHQNPDLRGEEIVRSLHRQLLDASHPAVVLTYADPAHAAKLVHAMPGYDGIVIRPAGVCVPVELLATLRRRSRAVVVEGMPMDGIDVDSVATDWAACIELGVRRLRDRGLDAFQLLLPGGASMYERVARRHADALARLMGIGLSVIDSPGAIRPDAGVMVWGASHAAKVAARTEDRRVVVIDTIDLPTADATRFTIVGRRIESIAADLVATLETRWREPDRPYVPRLITPHITDF